MANLELARNVSTLALLGDKAVELAGDWYLGATELAVTDAGDPNTPSPLARFGIAAPFASMFRDGSMGITGWSAWPCIKLNHLVPHLDLGLLSGPQCAGSPASCPRAQLEPAHAQAAQWRRSSHLPRH